MRDPILRSMVVHSREMLAELFRCAVVQQGRQSGQPTRERSSVMMSLDCLAAPERGCQQWCAAGQYFPRDLQPRERLQRPDSLCFDIGRPLANVQS